MPRTNKDIEDLHREGRGVFVEDTVTELFEDCRGESGSGKSIAYGDKGQSWKEWLWVPKSMIDSGEIKIKKLSNGFEIEMPRWFAERNGVA
jgi:hypothetical protein